MQPLLQQHQSMKLIQNFNLAHWRGGIGLISPIYSIFIRASKPIQAIEAGTTNNRSTRLSPELQKRTDARGVLPLTTAAGMAFQKQLLTTTKKASSGIADQTANGKLERRLAADLPYSTMQLLLLPFRKALSLSKSIFTIHSKVRIRIKTSSRIISNLPAKPIPSTSNSIQFIPKEKG